MDSHHKFPASRLKTDQFFLHWLALPENQDLVWQLVEDSKAGRPLRGPASIPSARNTPRSPRHVPSSAMQAVQAPVSPSKAASPRSSPSARLLRASASEKLAAEGAASNIATFYFPKAPPTATDVAAFRTTVSEAFAAHGGRVTAAELQALLPRTCACAGYIAYLAFEHLGLAAADARLGVADFVRWWAERDLVGADAAAALFQAVKRPGEAVVTQERLLAFMQHVLRRHPGLEFLQETAEFQERYAQTVVYRIMYLLDRSEKGHLTEADVRRSALPAAVAQLDTEDDINKVLKFFSYEHFYVMYCKFWELDQDHDFMIDRDDLLRYGGHGLTYRIVERIFGGAPRRMTCGTAGKMAYEDFVYFILSEEDKTTDASLKYWHRCIDLDDDGVITAQDMWFFYEEQLHRMESASQAPVSFGDVMCQMQDMLNPEQAGCFTLRDLRRGRALAGAMFNILFNLGKFVAYETRDPFVVRQERAEEPEATEWDRFARQEYIRLALEEETADDTQAEVDAPWEPQAEHLLEGVAIGGAHLLDGLEPMDATSAPHLNQGPLSPSFLA